MAAILNLIQSHPWEVVTSPDGTLISIERQGFHILRSSDGGKTWNEVYRQPETEHVHGVQGLRDMVVGYVTHRRE